MYVENLGPNLFNVFQANLRVADSDNIDREKIPDFEVTVTIIDLANNSASLEVSDGDPEY